MRTVYAGDRDRDRAAAALQEHYARGRISLEELTERISQVLAARSRGDIRHAFGGLPLLPDLDEFAARGRAALHNAKRGVVLALLTTAYLLFSFTLLVVFAVVLLVQGATTAMLLGFLVVWLVPTFLMSRIWRRSRFVRR
jgi:uncharacterized protein DUF1707